MLPASAPLPPDAAAAVHRAAAQCHYMRFDVRWFPSLGSTMDAATEAALAGAPEGLVIIAEEQTAGRGRRGHRWSSPSGAGLYLSCVLRPPIDDPTQRVVALLTMAAGVAVHDAIVRATGLDPSLKWPNDVMFQRRKVAGILAEGAAIGTPMQTVVLGIGVNVHDAVHDRAVVAGATSLAAEAGRDIDRMMLLEALLVALARRYDDLRRGDVDGILRAWRGAAPLAQGASVEWETSEGVCRGVTSGIDDSGALLVRTERGTARLIAGDVRWI
jgi:BirA family biotin operon repressor/biotin-[acetyl-CoA-carboxylase] ligase